MRCALDPVGENSCAASNVGHPESPTRSQLGEHLVLCRTIYPALKHLKVVGGGGEAEEPRDGVVEPPASCRRHHTNLRWTCSRQAAQPGGRVGRVVSTSTRWQGTNAPRGDDYDARWRRLAAGGQNIHGEADLVEALLRQSGGSRVLDAGCGTGRVAVELAARGFSVVGVDVDKRMLTAARAKNPELEWIEADLSEVRGQVDAEFDVVLLAGNVMIFLEPASEGRVVHELGACLAPGALLVAGFAIRPGRLELEEYDQLVTAAGLQPVARWATWDRAPFTGGDYAVSVHRRPPAHDQIP